MAISTRDQQQQDLVDLPEPAADARWCPSGRSGSGSISAALALIWPEMLLIITPSTSSPELVAALLEVAELVEAARRPATAAPCRRAPPPPPLRHRAFQRFALCHGHVRRQEPSEQFARFANGIGLARHGRRCGAHSSRLSVFACPPQIQRMRSNAASAGAVAVGLVALLSLTKRTPSFSRTRSMRCGRPGKVRRPFCNVVGCNASSPAD